MNDKKNIDKKQDQNNRNSHVGFGIGFGLLGGAAFSTIVGMFFEFPLIWAFGPAIGMLIGIVIGVMMDKNEGNIKKEEIDKIIKIALISFIGIILILLVPKIISYIF